MAILKRYLQHPSSPITVALIGVGGTGSMLLTHLARINSALHAIDGRSLRVTVYDFDEVSPANLGRQMFAPADIGRNKAQVLVERVNTFYGLGWTAITKPATSDCLNYNIVISCTDTKQSRLDLSRWLQAKTNSHYQHMENYFWIDCGNGQHTGNVIVASRQYGWKDVTEFMGWTDAEDRETPSCSIADAIAKQDLFVNSWMANIAGTWLWQFLHNKQINWRGAFLDLQTLRLRKIPVENTMVNHECEVSVHQNGQRRDHSERPAEAGPASA